MATTTPTYDYWQEALEGRLPPMTETNPGLGFYYYRRVKDGPRIPVAIFINNNEVCAVIGDNPPVTGDAVNDIWMRCARHPITESLYRHRRDTGEWADEGGVDPTAAASNAPSDPFEALSVEIQDYAASADSFLRGNKTLANDMACDIAANMRKQLIALDKRATAMHQAEKSPHLAAGRAVDAKYAVLRDMAATAANRLRALLDVYLVAKQAELDRKAKAEAERIAAEARAAMAETGEVSESVQVQVTPQKARAGGAHGARTGLRVTKEVRIDDYAKVLDAVKNHPLVEEAVLKAATALLKAGAAVPGTSTVEVARAA